MKWTFLLLLFAVTNCYTSKDKLDKGSISSLIQSDDMGTIQVNIVGDSLSEYSNAFGLQNKLGSNFQVNDFSLGGRTVLDWLNDISRPFNPSPNIFLIELGTNDAMMPLGYDFYAFYNRLLFEIQIRSNAKIILTALPVTNNPSLKPKIQTYNNYIRNLSNSAYRLADIEKALENIDPNTSLYPSYDLIHPHPFVYEIIGEVYKKEILLLAPSLTK